MANEAIDDIIAELFTDAESISSDAKEGIVAGLLDVV